MIFIIGGHSELYNEKFNYKRAMGPKDDTTTTAVHELFFFNPFYL